MCWLETLSWVPQEQALTGEAVVFLEAALFVSKDNNLILHLAVLQIILKTYL